MTIKLYHGSYAEVKEPLVNIGRKNLDFGQGFYLTNIKEQAEIWAKIVATRKGKNVKPVINVYDFFYIDARNIGFRFKEFEYYDIEWLNFVVDCRKGKDVFSKYDIVIGGVANDKVIDTVEDYEKGIITAEQALGQLKHKDVNHQVCILNQEIIEYHLNFVESYTLEENL
ncbi:MAG: DUF3990 domain-containing protein [Bacteroidales bacterium]|nr:DUF3990 domain-containing protein [Bacteroidales bacterium]